VTTPEKECTRQDIAAGEPPDWPDPDTIACRTLETMAVRLREAPTPADVPVRPLDEVLRRVNGIRIAHGADPLYELPAACTAWDGGGCVLERAFADLGVVIVDYQRAHGRGIDFEHGLGDFIRAFDAGRFPGLLDQPGSSRAARFS
jgi:hypothetical protein